jgi:hypothetical protein
MPKSIAKNKIAITHARTSCVLVAFGNIIFSLLKILPITLNIKNL